MADTLVRSHDRIDLLVNNVGMHSTTVTRTASGLETVFCVNHLASFALTWRLLDTMRHSAPSRIVQVNSQGHRFGGLNLDDLGWEKRHYTGLRGYGASKTAQLLTVWEFADLLRGSGVTINAMHPGAVKSNIGMNNGPLYRWFQTKIVSRTLSDPDVAGRAIQYLATAPELESITGQYLQSYPSGKAGPSCTGQDGGATRMGTEPTSSRTGMSARRRSAPRQGTSVDPGATTHDLIVVGGGMAGLTASASAARAGHSVLLCDKEAVLGGLINSFERNGFTWDVGIRALEDSGIIFPMLESLGISVDFVGSPVSIGIEDRVIPVESSSNLIDYQALLEHFYPEDSADIARIVDDIQQVMKHMDVLYGIENPAFKDLRHDPAYLFKKLVPWLGKFLLTIGKINRMDVPVEEYLETFSRSRPLIDIISQHFFKRTPAFFAMSYFSLYLDYVYPMGGTGTLPRALETYCVTQGVDIRRKTRITRVDPVRAHGC